MEVTELCQPISTLDASFTPPTPLVGEVVTFTGSATGTLPISYTWDFGDGFSGTGEVVTHSFLTNGEHTVDLTAQNACDAQTLELVVPVVAACEPLTDLTGSFTPLTPILGEVVTLTASASGTLPITYTWDFGDGFTAFGDVVTHAFGTVGDHTVILTGQNTCDLQSQALIVPVEALCTPPAELDIQISPTHPWWW
jgi:chitinase